MIPISYIKEWAQLNPWQSDEMVEQDLIISRALIEIYQSDLVKGNLYFRGGTALNKIFLETPYRYSEDIDLMRLAGGSVGREIDAIRDRLDSWLGTPNRDFTPMSVKLIYKYKSTTGLPKKVKIEINIEERTCFKDKKIDAFQVNSSWWSGKEKITTFCLEELLATKLRALYQRKKGRDLFDLFYVFNTQKVDKGEVISLFKRYMANKRIKITREDFAQNLEHKKNDKIFHNDIKNLLPYDVGLDFDTAFNFVVEQIVLMI